MEIGRHDVLQTRQIGFAALDIFLPFQFDVQFQLQEQPVRPPLAPKGNGGGVFLYHYPRLAVLDICPTLEMFESTDRAFATGYYHWFFLIQPFDLPERMIGADPEFYLRRKLGHWGRDSGAFTPEAMAEYIRCFSDRATIHAT